MVFDVRLWDVREISASETDLLTDSLRKFWAASSGTKELSRTRL